MLSKSFLFLLLFAGFNPVMWKQKQLVCKQLHNIPSYKTKWCNTFYVLVFSLVVFISSVFNASLTENLSPCGLSHTKPWTGRKVNALHCCILHCLFSVGLNSNLTINFGLKGSLTSLAYFVTWLNNGQKYKIGNLSTWKSLSCLPFQIFLQLHNNPVTAIYITLPATV